MLPPLYKPHQEYNIPAVYRLQHNAGWLVCGRCSQSVCVCCKETPAESLLAVLATDVVPLKTVRLPSVLQVATVRLCRKCLKRNAVVLTYIHTHVPATQLLNTIMIAGGS